MTTPYGPYGWEQPAQPTQYPVQTPATQAYSAPPAQPRPAPGPASGGARLGAHLLDGLVVGIPLGIIYLILMLLATYAFYLVALEINPYEAEFYTIIFFWLIPASFGNILYYLYKSLAEGKSGRNVGKRIVKLRVVTTTGEPMSFRIAAKRNMWLLISAIPIVGPTIGSVMALMILIQSSDGKPAFNDRAAGTVVLTQ